MRWPCLSAAASRCSPAARVTRSHDLDLAAGVTPTPASPPFCCPCPSPALPTCVYLTPTPTLPLVCLSPHSTLARACPSPAPPHLLTCLAACMLLTCSRHPAGGPPWAAEARALGSSCHPHACAPAPRPHRLLVPRISAHNSGARSDPLSCTNERPSSPKGTPPSSPSRAVPSPDPPKPTACALCLSRLVYVSRLVFSTPALSSYPLP